MSAETIGTTLRSSRHTRTVGRLATGDAPAHLPFVAGRSGAWAEIAEKASHFARTYGRVLLGGERGVGKFAVAYAVHELCGGGKTFVVRDVADRTSEGVTSWIRRTESVLNGPPATVVIRHIELLNETGAQGLARVIDQMDDQSKVQLVATATTRSLGEQVPLFERFPNTISIAPLRQHAYDIPALINQWLGKGSCTPEVVSVLQAQEWPGNVRELLELLIALDGDGERRTPLSLPDLPSRYRLRRPRGLTLLEQTEYAVIVDALTACYGNKLHAAEQIGFSRSSLYRKIESFGINVDAFVK